MTAGAPAAAVLALLVAGCASPDYGRARETRFDRPYRGGAADVAATTTVPDSEGDVGDWLAHAFIGTVEFFSAGLPFQPTPIPGSPTGR